MRARAFHIRWIGGCLLASITLCITPDRAQADVFHLASGGTVEGDLIATTATTYQIRTRVGTVSLPLSAVARIEPKASPLAEYETRAAAAADTAAGQFEIAEWCRENGLFAQRKRHLQRAIELEPDFAPAREALGQVRVGALWVDGASAAERPPAPPTREDERAAAAAEARANWQRQISAIRRTLLESGRDRMIQQGLERIRQIHDPLAIVPLSRVLSEGGVLCRELLVEVLSSFDEDESTLNLAVLALSDPEAHIRKTALEELKRRGDPRLGPQFRRALWSDSDDLVRRAAQALAQIGYTSAVPDLIENLTVRRTKLVEVPSRSYLNGLENDFGARTRYANGSESLWGTPRIGICTGGSCVGPVFSGGGLFPASTEWQWARVTVFRTEVLDALQSLTGQNLGFDANEWRRWLKEQQR